MGHPPSFSHDNGRPLLVDSLAHLDRDLLLNLKARHWVSDGKGATNLCADNLGNILALLGVNEERCFLELVDALLNGHLEKKVLKKVKVKSLTGTS